MKQNNTGRKLKAIVAVVLVMAALFAMSSLVNAGIVELILGEEYEAVAAASSSSIIKHQCNYSVRTSTGICGAPLVPSGTCTKPVTVTTWTCTNTPCPNATQTTTTGCSH